MKTPLIARITCIAFALLVTLAMLAGIDMLAEVEAAAPQLAQTTAVRA